MFCLLLLQILLDREAISLFREELIQRHIERWNSCMPSHSRRREKRYGFSDPAVALDHDAVILRQNPAFRDQLPDRACLSVRAPCS